MYRNNVQNFGGPFSKDPRRRQSNRTLAMVGIVTDTLVTLPLLLAAPVGADATAIRRAWKCLHGTPSRRGVFSSSTLPPVISFSPALPPATKHFAVGGMSSPTAWH